MTVQVKCVFCNTELPKWTRFIQEIPSNNLELLEKVFIVCLDCLTGGQYPSDEDIEHIQGVWNRGLIVRNNTGHHWKPEVLKEFEDKELETETERRKKIPYEVK